jgi:hypothetical protein
MAASVWVETQGEGRQLTAGLLMVFPGIASVDSTCAGDRALTKPAPESDRELPRVIAAWPYLAGPIKAAILALVASVAPPSIPRDTR